MAHAGGLVVVFVFAAVGVFGTGGVHQGDLSPESIPEHCHFHCLCPSRLISSLFLAQKVAGPALQHEMPVKLRKRSGATTWDGGAYGFQQPGSAKSFSEH